MRTPFIAGNWKMFKTVSDAVVFAKDACLRDAVVLVRGKQPPLKCGFHLVAPVEHARGGVLVDHATRPRSNRGFAKVWKVHDVRHVLARSDAEIESGHDHATAFWIQSWSIATFALLVCRARFAAAPQRARRPRRIDGGTGGPHGVHAIP